MRTGNATIVLTVQKSLCCTAFESTESANSLHFLCTALSVEAQIPRKRGTDISPLSVFDFRGNNFTSLHSVNSKSLKLTVSIKLVKEGQHYKGKKATKTVQYPYRKVSK